MRTASSPPFHLALKRTLAEVADREQILPPIAPYQVRRAGRVPLIEYRLPGDLEAGALVAAGITEPRALGSPIRAVKVDRLGPNVWHTDVDVAMGLLEDLEESGKLWQHCQPKPSPLSAPQLRELQEVFGCKW